MDYQLKQQREYLQANLTNLKRELRYFRGGSQERELLENEESHCINQLREVNIQIQQLSQSGSSGTESLPRSGGRGRLPPQIEGFGREFQGPLGRGKRPAIQGDWTGPFFTGARGGGRGRKN